MDKKNPSLYNIFEADEEKKIYTKTFTASIRSSYVGLANLAKNLVVTHTKDPILN